MQLTRAGEYAVRCALFLAMQEPRRVVTRSEIVRRMQVPFHFLGKIAQALSRAGVIEIRKGARGGYRLARPAEDISLLEVVEAIEGPIFLNQCLVRPQSCSRSSFCAVHQVWAQAQERMREVLGSASLAELAECEKRRGQELTPGLPAVG
jgi:Rrf2 family protein